MRASTALQALCYVVAAQSSDRGEQPDIPRRLRGRGSISHVATNRKDSTVGKPNRIRFICRGDPDNPSSRFGRPKWRALENRRASTGDAPSRPDRSLGRVISGGFRLEVVRRTGTAIQRSPHDSLGRGEVQGESSDRPLYSGQFERSQNQLFAARRANDLHQRISDGDFSGSGASHDVV